ncbi:MAG: hypothetical protein PHC51_13620, partial [bacterium]|nr:hypothetical protein [bacterium]
DAFTRYANSPWASTSFVESLKNNSAEEASSILTAIQEIGLDPSDSKSLQGFADEAVIFLQLDPTAPENLEKVTLAVALKAKSEKDLSEKMTKTRGILAKESRVSLEELPDLFADGFRVKSANAAEQGTFSCARSNNIIACSNHEETIKSVLGNTAAKAPELFSSKLWKETNGRLPESGLRTTTGFIDLQKVKEVAKENKDVNFPFTAVAFASTMEKAPGTELIVRYDQNNEYLKGLLAKLSDSNSGSTLDAAPRNSMAVISLDAGAFRGLLQMANAAAAGGATSGMAAPEFMAPLLDSIKDATRISLIVQPPTLGQSFMPVPEVGIVIESKEPEIVAQRLVEVVDLAIRESGAAVPTIANQVIDGLPVQAIDSGMGVSFNASFKGERVFLTSTPTLLSSLIKTIGDPATSVRGLIAADKADRLFDRSSILDLFINFPQTVELAKNLRGMFGAYAGQAQAEQALSDKALEDWAKLQSFLLSVKVIDNGYTVSGSYSQLPAAS